jgi:hypothetical protein
MNNGVSAGLKTTVDDDLVLVATVPLGFVLRAGIALRRSKVIEDTA